MNSESEPLKTFASIFGVLKNSEINDDGNVSATLSLDPDIVKKLRVLADHGMIDSSVDLLTEGRIEASIGINDLNSKHFTFECKVNLVSNWEKQGYFVGRDWNELLRSPARLVRPVKQAFFIDKKELTSSEAPRYKRYRSLSKICNFIDQVSLPVDSDSSTRTIIFERDMSLIYSLTKSDLDHDISTEAIDRLLHKDLHHEAKVALVRGELIKFLKGKGVNQRFGYLVSNFNAFSSELLLSYQAYVEQYTFDKVRKEYQEKKTDYIQRVNNTYSDVGAKVLAIPAGLWLALFQLEEANIGTFSFYKNVITVFLCSLCFCYALFHFSAQFSVLKSLKDEYKSLFKRLANEHKDESVKILEAEGLIDKQADLTWWMLWFSNFATLVVFILVLVLSILSIN